MVPRLARRRADDAGVTLVEVVATIGLGTFVLTAVALALTVSLRTMDSASQRFSGSHDRQLLVSYLTTDVQSARSVGDSIAMTNACGPHAGDRLRLARPDGTGVSYRLLAGGEVRRVRCEVVSGAPVVVEQQVAANHVDQLLFYPGGSNTAAIDVRTDSGDLYTVAAQPRFGTVEGS